MTLIGDLFEHAAEGMLPHAATAPRAHVVPRQAVRRAAHVTTAGPVPSLLPRRRWTVLRSLEAAQSIPLYDRIVLSVMQALEPDATLQDARDTLSWLAASGMADLHMRAEGPWMAEISERGADVARYTCDAPAGIARPPVYW
ncbi:hypothetical protein [Rhodanobacter lindaniclasticus]